MFEQFHIIATKQFWSGDHTLFTLISDFVRVWIHWQVDVVILYQDLSQDVIPNHS